MKNVNEFVSKYAFFSKTFSGQVKYYKDINDKINDCLSKKEFYDKLIRENQTGEESDKLSFKEQWELYIIVDALTKRNAEDYDYLGINLLELKSRLEDTSSEIRDYLKINNDLKSLTKERIEILTENINFNIFSKDYFSERCINRHFFVRIDDELKCMCCGATTKDYLLTNEELDFLTSCASSQGILLKEVTKEDIPLLKVLMEKQDYYRSKREVLNPFEDEINDDYLVKAEEQFLEDESELPVLRTKIQKAHLLDSQKYDSEDIKVSNPKYLSDEKAKELLLKVEKDLEEVKTKNSRFEDLMVEECKTVKYEILILSGSHIPTLLKQIKDEDDKIALIKAYYNLSDAKFREDSEYFDSDIRSAIFYDCITANPEINTGILEMKLKRL